MPISFLEGSAFEVGQMFPKWSTSIIPDWFTGIPFLGNTENYFLKGTFDILDVIAIALGAVTAYLVLLRTDTANKEVQS